MEAIKEKSECGKLKQRAKRKEQSVRKGLGDFGI
jgi:hypothetical protein